MIQRKEVFGASVWFVSSFRFALVLSIIVQSKSDSRCFLENGGSSVSFFVSEDAPIGFNLGSLGIQGDVTRDIVLSLREQTAPVRIESGTKNLTLTRKLDKEGVEGPSTVTFTVLCDKRLHSEPSIHIPVTIRVLDVNDNSPLWIGGPFALNVSEQTLPGSTIMTGLKAVDLDSTSSPHSTLYFSALDVHGKPSNLISFSGGGLEGRLILVRPLDFESMPEFNVTLRVKDQGSPPLHSDTNLHIRVMDADDQNPRFQHVSYSALLPSNPRGGNELEIEPEGIQAYDQDTINAPIIYSMPEGRPESEFFQMDPSRGTITITRDIPDDQLNQPITLVLKAEQLDNPDRYALSTLNVGRKGNRNAPLHFVQPAFEISIPENSPPNTILFTALTSRPADRNLRFALNGDNLGLFNVGPMGQLFLKKPLDYETLQKHILKIWVTDGYQNASSTVTIHVLNVNDWGPRFRQPLYEFNVSSDSMAKGNPLGQIEVADGDLGDHLSLEIKNTDSIQVDSYGRLFARNRTLVKREMMFLVVAKDSGDPPREAFVPVVVRLISENGVDDEDFYVREFDIKIALISALSMVAFALAVGVALYFGYCRKRRKIQTENLQKRVMERNMSNPLAIHKIVHPNTLRRSNKVRNMALNITSPIIPPSRNHVSLTPVDPSMSNTTIIRPKNVTWSPKIVQRATPTPPSRNGGTRITSTTTTIGNSLNGFEIDPDTSVTPLETYQKCLPALNGRKSDTLQSNSSLTLYF